MNGVLMSVATWIISSKNDSGYCIDVLGSPEESKHPIKIRWMMRDTIAMCIAALYCKAFPLQPLGLPKGRKGLKRLNSAIASCFTTRASIWEFARGLGKERSARIKLDMGDTSPPLTPFFTGFTREELDLASSPGRILVYTQALTIVLQFYKDTEDGAKIFKICFPEEKGVALGYAWLTSHHFTKLTQASDGSSELYETVCLALSVAPAPDKDIARVDWEAVLGRPRERWFPYSQKWKEWDWEPPILNVMLTVAEDNGCRSRIGLGKVSLKKWYDSGPAFRTTILE